MTFVTVVRRVPQPIVGMCGVRYDRRFESLEANLDWLETTGMLVERCDPTTAPGDVTALPGGRRLLQADADRCLPLILVNDRVVSQGAYPSRAQLARVVGRGGHRTREASSAAA